MTDAVKLFLWLGGVSLMLGMPSLGGFYIMTAACIAFFSVGIGGQDGGKNG